MAIDKKFIDQFGIMNNMVPKALQKKIVHEIGIMNKRTHNMISIKIKNFSIEGKENFIREFTLSPLYKFATMITSSSACCTCIEDLKAGLDTDDFVKIGTFIELMNSLGWKNWKSTIDEQKLELEINKKEELKNLKVIDVLKKVLSHPNVCSKEWIWQQYDHTVMGDTIQKPGGDSGVVRVHGTDKAVAASVDSSAVYCWAHPLTGGKQVVCESFRNLISVGAKPVAITNCLNFGSPENEENMGEFVECVQGIGEAAGYLKFPVVSGNVSFYNQTKDEGIKPTPSIGGVGLIKDYKKMITMDFKQVDNIVLVIGKTEGHIDQSLLARNILNEKNGPPPEVNLFNEKNNGETVLKLIDAGHIKSAHDVSIGGIITAISKMCIKGNKGINLKKPKYLINEIEYYFGEDQGRYIIEVSKDSLKKVTDILNKNAVHYDELGTINEDQLFINEKTKVSIDELTTSNTNWLTNYMSK